MAKSDELPPPPWHRIQGTGDATTMWYAVMRKEVREGVFNGALCNRHQDQHASLLQLEILGDKPQEIPPREIAP